MLHQLMHDMLQILKMAPGQRTTGILAADGIFILTASLFFYCGHQFGLQRNGPTVPFPGTNVRTSQELMLELSRSMHAHQVFCIIFGHGLAKLLCMLTSSTTWICAASKVQLDEYGKKPAFFTAGTAQLMS